MRFSINRYELFGVYVSAPNLSDPILLIATGIAGKENRIQRMQMGKDRQMAIKKPGPKPGQTGNVLDSLWHA